MSPPRILGHWALVIHWALGFGLWSFQQDLSTIASNLRISSPDINLNHEPQITWRRGGTTAENLRTCHLSTPGTFLLLPLSWSFHQRTATYRPLIAA